MVVGHVAVGLYRLGGRFFYFLGFTLLIYLLVKKSARDNKETAAAVEAAPRASYPRAATNRNRVRRPAPCRRRRRRRAVLAFSSLLLTARTAPYKPRDATFCS
jgi:hypothetical protein